MNFSQAFIEKVLSHTNIIDVISKHTKLESKSGQYFALCPYPNHEEKTPSFSVSEEKQVYYCFGCQKSGNVITFLRDIQGMSFFETIEYLSSRAGIPLPKKKRKKNLIQTEKDKKTNEDPLQETQPTPSSFLKLKTPYSSFFEHKRTLYKIQELAMNFWHQKLLDQKNNPKLRDYFKKRNLSLETIKKFKIGWAESNGIEWIQFLKNKGVPLDLAHKTGLLRKNKKTSAYYDGFRNRLMFPIFSTQSQCIGFGGRTLEENILPKYLNSSESEIFQKSDIFYGLNESAYFIRESDKVFVVEGYIDFLSLFQKGIKNIVSTLGTALSVSQAKKLRLFTKNVILFFDGDKAGRKASLRSLLNLLSSGVLPRIFELPEGLDPDAWIQQKSLQTFKTETKRAPELFEVFLEEELKNFNYKPSEKLQILDKTLPILESILDPRLKNLYIDEISIKLDLKKEIIYKSLNLHAKNKPKNKFSTQNSIFSQKKTYNSKRFEEKNEFPLEEKNQKPSNHNNEKEKNEPEEDRAKESLLEIKLPVPKTEHLLFHLALKNEKRFLKLIKEDREVLLKLTHKGLKKIFDLAEKIYRQNPKIFDKMIALLMIKVKPTHILNPPSFINGMKTDSANQLASDCLFQIQDLSLQRKCAELSKKIELTDSPEETNHLLKEFMSERLKRQALQQTRSQNIN